MVNGVRKAVSVVVAVASLSSACSPPHVVLSAPPASASFDERGRAYEQLKPLSMHETHTTYYQGGAMVGASRTTDYLQLADGRRVYHAEDILSVVPEDSPSARAAHESDSRASTATTLSTLSWILITVGGVIMIAPLFSSDGSTSIDTTPIFIGGGIMLAGLPLIFISSSQRAAANDEKATAFETYEPGLRKKLDLCVQGQQVVDCRRAPAIPNVAGPGPGPRETTPAESAPSDSTTPHTEGTGVYQ